MTAERSTPRRFEPGSAIGLSLFAAIVVVVAAWMAERTAIVGAERELDRRLEAYRSVVSDEIRQRGLDVRRDLESLATALQQPGSTDLSLLASGGAAAVGVAGPLARAHRLALLTVLGPQGRVLSCSYWPERAGLVAAGLGELPEDEAVVTRLGFPDGTRLVLLARAEVSTAVGKLDVVAGVPVDASVVCPAGSGDVACVLTDGDDRSRERVSRAGPPLPDFGSVTLDPPSRTIDAGRPYSLSGGGRRATWRALRVELDPGLEPPAGLVLAMSRSAVLALQRRLRGSFLILAGVAGVAGGAIGGWYGGRSRRPVARLVRAVDAIAAGEADYGFDGLAADSLHDVAAAFSRLERSLEAQRERAAVAERVAAWREIARHVAHEVKNPLVPIRLTVENLRRARDGDPDRFAALFADGARTILEEVEQLQRLVSEFSEFARLPAPTRRREDVHALLDGVLDLYGAESGVEIVREYADGLPALEIDPDQISRVFKNVVANALEAIAGAHGGRHSILVRTTSEGGGVSVDVCDTGPGFDAGTERRVFEPYFSTKGRGSGLGMAIVLRIVTEHGGRVSAGNRAEGGARITIHLPAPVDGSDRQHGAREVTS